MIVRRCSKCHHSRYWHDKEGCHFSVMRGRMTYGGVETYNEECSCEGFK